MTFVKSVAIKRIMIKDGKITPRVASNAPKNPACEEKGEVTYSCACGESYTEEVAELGHAYENRVCTTCGGNYFSPGLQYSLNDDSISYSVTGIGECTDLDIYIPATYECLPVTGIGDSAFNNCGTLTSVEIPDSVTSIGEATFYCCSWLISVEIGDSVTSIGDMAFMGCGSLTNVKMPESVAIIGHHAFYGCASLTSMVIPDLVTSIGSNAFTFCRSLTSVVIGDSVKSIGWSLFSECTALTSIYYKGTVDEWNNITFFEYNESLINATRYYYSETEPTETGNWWHYVDGVPTAW
jgi:hypothetical protein